jgi:hypothetical protein
MTKRRTRRGAALAAVAAMAPGVGWALPEVADAREVRPARQQAAPGDVDAAELYTRAVDVDIAEARRRLANQDDLNTALGELRALAGDRFAGAWIEHEPDYRGVVRLSGPVGDQAALDAVVAAAPVPIDVRTDAPLSLAGLQAEQTRVQEDLRLTLPGATTGIHEQTGSINVYAPAENQAERDEGAAAVGEVRETTDAPVRVRYQRGEARAQEEYGGDRLNGCTSGFTVWHGPSGQDGVLSAGHCGANQWYLGYDGDVFPLTRAAVKWDAGVDMAVYTSNEVAMGGEFYVSPTNRLTLQDVLPWQFQQVGDFVCHHGITTGNSCGFITDRASSICDLPPVTGQAENCNANWVRVEGPSTLECNLGDSGGPWYTPTTFGAPVQAAGIHHGGWTTMTGECTAALYNPIDFAANVGATVLVP